MGWIIMFIFVRQKPINKPNLMTTKKLTRDDRMDIAIEIVNELISLEYIPDCTDTDDDTEFNVQEVIARILKESKLRKKVVKVVE